MNLKSHSTFKILFFTIYLLMGILLSLSKNTQYLSTEYNFILTAYFITGGAWGLCIYKKNIYIITYYFNPYIFEKLVVHLNYQKNIRYLSFHLQIHHKAHYLYFLFDNILIYL